MKTTIRTLLVNTERELLLAVDVSRDRLSERVEIPRRDQLRSTKLMEAFEGTVANRSRAIHECAAFRQRAALEGYEGVQRAVFDERRITTCLSQYHKAA